MAIIAKASSGSDFIPAPAGTWAAVCVDVVDLGILEVTFGGKTKKQHKIRIVWQIDESMPNNKPYTASKRYTLSLHEKAALRKDLESWRGRAFTNDELQGFDVETVLSVAALLNIIEERKPDGKTYSNIASIMRLPKAMQAPTARDYIRVIDREPTKSEAVVGHPDEEPPMEDYNQFGVTDDDVPF